MEQLVFFPERVIVIFNVGQSNLIFHICICHLRDIGYIENGCKTKDKYCNSKINPLDSLQRIDIISCCSEKYIRAKYRSYNCANGVESLSKVDSDFGIFWWTANYRALY